MHCRSSFLRPMNMSKKEALYKYTPHSCFSVATR
jgi:hypothetical protein